MHRVGGICAPASAAYATEELVHQLKSARATALCTCGRLLSVALEAAKRVNIPQHRIFLFDPEPLDYLSMVPDALEPIENMIRFGATLPPIEPQAWSKGEGAKRVAFLCSSSGTSGLPKSVMISHRNVIANILQISTNEQNWRSSLQDKSKSAPYSEVVLDVLPQSHIYGLLYICHLAFFRGDQVVVLPRFDLKEMLQTIDQYRINTLMLVPPIITSMAKEKALLSQYDLDSVTSILTGAAPLGGEIAEQLHSIYPSWLIRQGYGLTESATVVSSSMPWDMWFGSSGTLIPGFQARLVSEDGAEVENCDEPGELLLRSPSIVLGYLNNDKANAETFDGPWLRTGDIAEFRRSPAGNNHLWIVDRKKELIKVKVCV